MSRLIVLASAHRSALASADCSLSGVSSCQQKCSLGMESMISELMLVCSCWHGYSFRAELLDARQKLPIVRSKLLLLLFTYRSVFPENSLETLGLGQRDSIMPLDCSPENT